MTDTSAEIVVVPHTHWDREWYEPHDVFRLRLVHMIDGLLDLLENEPEYCFTLDGQAAAIDDYLEMRPESLPRVQRAIEAGQLAIGPFLILLDEFCCDGETIIRNLELGIRSSRRIGTEMRVGYLPDMFGHAAQTPQILRGFGIKDAALWRGVPDAVRSNAFIWEALDGSTVRCQYLFDGYGNGLDLFALRGQLPTLAAQYLEETASWRDGRPALAMLGSDHTAPPTDLVEQIGEARTDSATPNISIETLEGYLSRFGPHEALPQVRGELRSHARGNLLPGVFSIRTNLKEAMSHAERSLSVAERLDTLFPSHDHQSFLDTAWYRLVESTAHDSVTGCGVDATAEQVGTRLHTAAHIARGVSESALRTAAAQVSAADHLVVNPSAFPRLAQAEFVVNSQSTLPAGAQKVAELPVVLGDEQMRTDELVKILRRIHGRELFGQLINGYQWGEDSLRFDVAEVPVGTFDLAAFTTSLNEAVQTNAPDKLWHVETIAAPRSRVLVQVPLDGMGVALASTAVVGGSVQASEREIRSDRLRVAINGDGTIDIFADGYEARGALQLVDEGDRGDSYNYGPLAKAEPITQTDEVSVTVLESGPLRGKVAIERTYNLPEALNDTDPDLRSAATVPLKVTTVVELREGEDFLRVEIDLVNTVRDHRLRVLLPTGVAGLEGSVSAGQYGVTHRGRQGEGGWGEYPLPTFPATVFAAAGEVSALLDKLTEYEIVEGPQSDYLALTLLRSVGMMSVNVHPLRDEPAGSEIPVPGAQYLGERVTTRFAILPSSGGWQSAGALRQADLFRFDPCVVRGEAAIDAASVLPVPAVSLQADGEVPLTSLRRLPGGDRIEARFVNYLDADAPLDATVETAWVQTDLGGEPLNGPGLKPGLVRARVPAQTVVTFRA